MRKHLANVGYRDFICQISAYGADEDGFPTTAVQNVRDQQGKLVTDHVWVQRLIKVLPGRQDKSIGKIVSFKAKSQCYSHHNSDMMDYGLADVHEVFQLCNFPSKGIGEQNEYLAITIRSHQDMYFIGTYTNGRVITFTYGEKSQPIFGSTKTEYFRDYRDAKQALISLISQRRIRQKHVKLQIFKAIRYVGQSYIGVDTRDLIKNK
ncbi:hypothetical protein [Lentilactobacillus sunkii]|uniref:Uncharacterized protein n=1 Tax=Lentilactobacillus sunkii DSM 19904 TaxID=1423808 RepID=A0A0R1L1V7_9LACO|nr:hypothetical protein [Lentilactobacillus sunkii]KRK89544.1 hypothetical protein FD17_GL001132 [Lentilactobacillus sunkii DSM 19904]